MQDFNIHSHTSRCHHAVGTDEEYVQKAIEANLRLLGFSDHVPLIDDEGMNDRMSIDQTQEYINSVLSLKQKYKNQIDLKLGFECEYFENKLNYYKDLLNKCDYLILGHHYDKPNSVDYCEFCDDERVANYANEVCKGIESGLFTYLAHPDYFMLSRESWSDACTAALEKILLCANQHDFPLEINLKGLSYGKRSYPDGDSFIYPNKHTIELFKKYNPKVVFGLDCHNPEFYAKMKNYIQSFINEYPDYTPRLVTLEELEL